MTNLTSKISQRITIEHINVGIRYGFLRLDTKRLVTNH